MLEKKTNKKQNQKEKAWLLQKGPCVLSIHIIP